MPLNLDALVARLPGRRKRRKHETVEQATQAPGELRRLPNRAGDREDVERRGW